MKHLLEGASVLLRKLIRNPYQSVQVNDDTDFNAGTWMVHVLTFGLATAKRDSKLCKGADEEIIQRPAFLNEAEQQLFRLFPQIMHSICVAWGRTSTSFGEERGIGGSTIGSSDDFHHEHNTDDSRLGSLGRRRSSSFHFQHTTSRTHKRELDALHVRYIQQQIVDLVAPFFVRHCTLVFVSMLNNWEKELNTSNVWALRMQSTVRRGRGSTGSISSAMAMTGDFPEHHNEGMLREIIQDFECDVVTSCFL